MPAVAVCLRPGWVAEVLVDRPTGNVVDGHLHIELAHVREEPTVPVTERWPLESGRAS
jgi:hypothetical protein